MAKDNKVLIIGAGGMLGQELVNIFKKDTNYEVSTWDKSEIDITDEKQVDRKVSELNPSIILNAAAYNAVDKCENSKIEFDLAKKLNGLAPGYLAKVAKKLGATFIHYSTDYVFDGNPDIPEPEGCANSCSQCSLHKDFKPEVGFEEDDTPNPISNYGKSKLMGEQVVQKTGGNFYIIRLSKLFGKPAKSSEGKKSFFDMMLELAKSKKEVRVVDEEISCFTYAPDLAKKTKEIIEAKKPFGIYHITNSTYCTWYEATLELYKQTKIKAKVIPVDSDEFPRPAERPYISTLINTKLNPLRSYKQALKEYLKK